MADQHRPQEAVKRIAPTLRRRVDNEVLRWQARLETSFSDRSLPWIFAGGLFLVLVALATARSRTLEPSESLGRYVQATRELHRGTSTSLTLLPPGVRAPQPLLHLEGSLLLYPLGWLLGFLPVAQALVAIQAAALSITVVPLWRLARRVANLRAGAAMALLAAYALYPPLHLMNTAGFDPKVLALPALMALAHHALSGSVVRFIVAAAVVIALSSQFALVFIGFGILLACTVRRRAGIALTVVGVAAAIGEQTVSWLGAGDRAFVDGTSYPAGVTSALGVWADAVTHPLASLSHLGEQRVLVILAALLLPAALLPFMSLRHLAPVVPLQLTYLLGTVPSRELLGPLASAPTVFVFVASTFALSRLGRQSADRIAVPSRLSGALIGVAVLFFALDSPTSPYERPWQWRRQDALDQVRLMFTDAVLAQRNDTMVVAATPDMTPRLAGRVAVCTLPLDRFDCPAPPTVYLLDRTLDATTPMRSDLRVVDSQADGRFLWLVPATSG